MRLARASMVAALAMSAAACAGRFRPAPPGALAALQQVPTYSAVLHVSVRGPELRGRTGAIVAWRRPSDLRVEVAGPGGARLLAVARDGRLTAVFPADRAVFRSAASAEAFADLLGIHLAPADVIDLLTGTPPAGVREYRADWGPAVPRRVEASLADGAWLKVRIEDPELGVPLPERAFDPPPHEGFRSVAAEEARSLWSR